MVERALAGRVARLVLFCVIAVALAAPPLRAEHADSPRVTSPKEFFGSVYSRSKAAYAILNRPAKECSGNFFIDDEVLAAEGVTDFDKYAVSPGTPLMPDFFVPAPGAKTVVGRA